MRGNSFCRQKWRRTNRGSNTFALTAVKWAPRFGDGVGNCNFTKISSNFCAFRRVFLWYFLDIFWIFSGYFLDIFLIFSWYCLDIILIFLDFLEMASTKYPKDMYKIVCCTFMNDPRDVSYIRTGRVKKADHFGSWVCTNRKCRHHSSLIAHNSPVYSISSNFCAFRRVFFWIFSGYFLDIFLILSGYFLDIVLIFSGYFHDFSSFFRHNVQWKNNDM